MIGWPSPHLSSSHGGGGWVSNLTLYAVHPYVCTVRPRSIDNSALISSKDRCWPRARIRTHDFLFYLGVRILHLDWSIETMCTAMLPISVNQYFSLYCDSLRLFTSGLLWNLAMSWLVLLRPCGDCSAMRITHHFCKTKSNNRAWMSDIPMGCTQWSAELTVFGYQFCNFIYNL